jgi:GNAT superfamily N-acetyltransferase
VGVCVAPPGVKVRSATAADRAEVERLVRALRAAYGRRAGRLEPATWEALVATPGRSTLLAEVGGRIAGMIVVRRSYSALRGRPFLFAGDLVVLPRFRRQGVARALLARVERLARAAGCDRVNMVVDQVGIAAFHVAARAGYTKLDDVYLTLPIRRPRRGRN